MGCGSSTAVKANRTNVAISVPSSNGKRSVSPKSQKTNETSAEKRQRVVAGEEKELSYGDSSDVNVFSKGNENNSQNAPALPNSEEIREHQSSKENPDARISPELPSHEGSPRGIPRDGIENDDQEDSGPPTCEQEGGLVSAMDTAKAHRSVGSVAVVDVEKVKEEEKLASSSCISEVRTKLKKEDLYDDISIFQKVDEHALKASDDKSLSIEDLANYLIAPFETDLFRFRALWRWITANIEYDVDSFFGNGRREENDTFASRKGVCDGYASIAQDLFKLGGIESVKVCGWAKGYNYSPGSKFIGTKSNHAWNAVKLKDQWWLCDMTWGAGYVGSDKKFNWDYTEHYFLTNPEEFITNHFPMDSTWQLVNPLVKAEEFESWANFTKHFYALQLKPLSHKQGVIKIPSGILDVTLGYDKDVEFTVDIVDKGSGRSTKGCCFLHWSGGTAHFWGRFPHQGTFILRIYGKHKQSEGNSYFNLVNYVVECDNGLDNWAPFPSFNGSWKEGFILHEPLQGELQRDLKVKFRINTPDNMAEMFVCVKGDGDWVTMIKGEDSTWEATVHVVETAKEVKILGNDINAPDSAYNVLLNYVVRP